MLESAFEFVFTNYPLIGVWLFSLTVITLAVWKIGKLVNSIDNIAIKTKDLNDSLIMHIVDDKSHFDDLHTLNDVGLIAATKGREKNS